jgi:transcriptional regulator with XRE-family HTH domain
VDAEDASAIGARARKIRRRRGLSLDLVAGFAGISTPWNVDSADSTGGAWSRISPPRLVARWRPDRAAISRSGSESAEALASLQDIRLVLNDYAPDERPTGSPRPLEALVSEIDDA